MGTMGGMAALRRQRAAQQAEFGKGDRGAFIPELDMRASASAFVQLIGPSDEPYLYGAHRVKEYRDKRESFKVRPCAQGVEGFPGCVDCHAYAQGNKQVNRVSDRAAWQVVDCRWLHKVPLIDKGQTVQKRDNSGPVLVNRACTGASCSWCKSKNAEYKEKKRGGHARLDLSTMYAETLLKQADEIAEFCFRCWDMPSGEGPTGGVIERLAFVCSSCTAPVPLSKFDPDDPNGDGMFVCVKCKRRMEPAEVVRCSNACDEARRTTAWDGRWKLTKSGTGTSTNWAFQFLGVKPWDEWMEEIEIIDLRKYYLPAPCAVRAKALNIPNPFQGGKTETHSGEVPDEEEHNSNITGGTDSESYGADGDPDADIPF